MTVYEVEDELLDRCLTFFYKELDGAARPWVLDQRRTELRRYGRYV